MTVTHMEILGREGARRPSLGLTRHTRDALAEYCRLRWPTGRRKAVAREWSLTPDEARAVCEATPGAQTVDKIWKHPNGGWSVLVPVLGAVIGHSFEHWLNQERGRLARERTRLEAQERRLVALAGGVRALDSVPRPDMAGVWSRLDEQETDDLGGRPSRGDRWAD